MEYTKRERLNEFLRRLSLEAPVGNAQESRDQMARLLNQVEDEMTSIPYDPSKWKTDGRMYPPFDDSIRAVPGWSTITRFRHVGHNTFLAANGAIEIQNLQRVVLFTKKGANGKGVWQR